MIVAVLLLVGNVYADIDQSFMPTKCEICALVAMEIDKQAARVHKRISSEFADLSENICQGFNEFHIHKEKTGVERFSRAPSKTIETLKQMREKGVDVNLGMPYEMWDQPSAEIFALRQGCESLFEDYEELIEQWFLRKEPLNDLLKKLCLHGNLKRTNANCLPLKPKNNEL